MALRAVTVVGVNSQPTTILIDSTVAVKVKVNQDLGTLAAGATTVTFPVPGAIVGDSVLVNPSILLPDTIFLVQYHISGAGTVDVIFYNISGGPVVVGPQDILFTLFVD